MLKDYFLNRQLKRIEREANDDLIQVLHLGPAPFSTPELKALLRRIDRQYQEVLLLRKQLFIAGSASVLLTGLSFLFQAMSWNLISLLTLALAPGGLIIFAVGSIIVSRRFPTFGHSQPLEKAIREELERRRKDASIS